ncbi:MAG: ferredoxin reductase family protein, partial [Pseudomonadota bacterium]
LDQSYRLHKWLGLWALAASFMHDTIDADMRGLGAETVLTDIAETAGEVSLYGLLLLVVITVATFIPYHLWKWTHRFIGVFFVLSAFHYLFILKPFSNADPLGLYMGLVCVIGLIAYAYTSAPRRFRPSRAYRVTHLDKAGDALAVTLQPTGRALKHRAGQFAFISFAGLGLGEPHPFTLSSAPDNDGGLRMTIGPLGDYTIRLMSRLQVGAEARVEGPFGDFGIARGPQVWVAAGIGITPFAAMAGSIAVQDGPVTLIYSVRNRQQAAHLDELEAVAAKHDNFTLVLRETSTEGRLTPADVASAAGDFKKAHVLYCGPAALRQSIWNGLKGQGLSARRFHYERFEIRTGVGLEYLFKKLLDRAVTRANKANIAK